MNNFGLLSLNDSKIEDKILHMLSTMTMWMQRPCSCELQDTHLHIIEISECENVFLLKEKKEAFKNFDLTTLWYKSNWAIVEEADFARVATITKSDTRHHITCKTPTPKKEKTVWTYSCNKNPLQPFHIHQHTQCG